LRHSWNNPTQSLKVPILGTFPGMKNSSSPAPAGRKFVVADSQ